MSRLTTAALTLVGGTAIDLAAHAESVLPVTMTAGEISDIAHNLNTRALSPNLSGFGQAQSWFQDMTPIVVHP